MLPERFLTKVARDGDTFQMAVLNVVLQVSVDVFFPANLAPINQLAPGIFNRGFLHQGEALLVQLSHEIPRRGLSYWARLLVTWNSLQLLGKY